MKKMFALALMLVMALSFTSVVAAQDAKTPDEICAGAAPAAEPASRTFAQPDQVLQAGTDYRAVLCTDAGAVYVDLFEAYAPVTVNSFVFLAQKGYFNNTTFHRVIQDFMAQGGDPTGTGSGGPGYQFKEEFAGFLNFDRPGWLAMANANQPQQGITGTNGSQFFITTAAYPSLNFGYTIFGEVLEGQANVSNIKLRDPQTATEPGTSLKTVVVVTDPATVKTAYTAPTPATKDEVVTAFANVARLTEGSPISHAESTATTDEVVAAAPEAIRDRYSDFLTQHGHQYRSGSLLTVCALDQVPFMAVSYTLDAFGTREDASVVLADPLLDELEAANGFTKTTAESLSSPLYTKAITTCDTPAIDAVTYWQRGHFLVRAEAIMPADSQVQPERYLTDLVGLRVFEYTLSDILRRELR